MGVPLRRQILLILAGLFLPLFAVIVWSARLTLLQQQDQLREESQALAASIAAYLDLSLTPAGGAADLTAAQAVLAAIPVPDGSVVTVTDERGIVIARSRDAERYIGQAGTLGAHGEGAWTGVRLGVDGVNRLYTIAPIGRSARLVGVRMPVRLALARTLPIYRRNATIVGGLIALLLTVGVATAWRLARAVRHLEHAADRAGGGNLEPFARAPMPSREFERLQDTFAAMIARLRLARDAAAAQVVEERRMREEVESLQRQIIRQERLAAIGVLVSGVAHELNNPLQTIYGCAELLQARADLPDDVRADLTVIEKESARSAAIISNLSRFGRQQGARSVAVQTEDLITSVMELRHRKLNEMAIAVTIDDGARAPMLAVFTELQQVLLNLVINSEHAMVSGGRAVRRLTIRTADVGDRVRIEVEDTGLGVAPDDESKLFQPFFSTKPLGEGTGLGLSVSYGIIQGYGGTVGYRGGRDGGAVFWFELPAMQDPG